jgi:hypothetical protein
MHGRERSRTGERRRLVAVWVLYDLDGAAAPQSQGVDVRNPHFSFNFSRISCLAKNERFFLPKISVGEIQ